jgi:hypothetical protein
MRRKAEAKEAESRGSRADSVSTAQSSKSGKGKGGKGKGGKGTQGNRSGKGERTAMARSGGALELDEEGMIELELAEHEMAISAARKKHEIYNRSKDRRNDQGKSGGSKSKSSDGSFWLSATPRDDKYLLETSQGQVGHFASVGPGEKLIPTKVYPHDDSAKTTASFTRSISGALRMFT